MTDEIEQARQHLEILTYISLGMAAIPIVAIVWGLLALNGVFVPIEPQMSGPLLGGLLVLGGLMLVTAALYLATGIGLRKRWPWARVTGLGVSALSLVTFTPYGIYGLYVLTRPGVGQVLDGSPDADV